MSRKHRSQRINNSFHNRLKMSKEKANKPVRKKAVRYRLKTIEAVECCTEITTLPLLEYNFHCEYL